MVTERRGSNHIPTAPNQTVEELREALTARDELIAVMGHELRNAMAPLVLLAQQFEMMPAVDDMMKKKVAMLSRNLKTFTTTLDRVGEVSGLRAGKLDLELAQVDAAQLTEEVCRELAPMAKAGNCELRVETSSVVGHWDRDRLAQIVRHLVTNAIRYASGAPIEVTVCPVDNQKVEIVVQDHGPGIAVGDRDRLFDRFDRATSRRGGGGLGVGLWVVKALSQAMGGSVHLADSIRGARFCVALPRG